MRIILPVKSDTANAHIPPSIELTPFREADMGVGKGYVVIQLRDPDRRIQVSRDELERALTAL